MPLFSVASAVPANPGADLSGPGTLGPGTLGLCTGPGVGVNCTDFQLVSGSSSGTALTGALSFLNQEVISVVVPDKFLCTFFQGFTCTSSGANGEVSMTEGVWNLAGAPGASGSVDFSDLTGSFSCVSSVI
ncbi:hypothetical protein K438DRAFT_1962206 [Mycena galopus ATCC 62051]|nr:hypothetical protein K438DRAFT_1962206 [Mycena galopus ATCC 62051]